MVTGQRQFHGITTSCQKSRNYGDGHFKQNYGEITAKVITHGIRSEMRVPRSSTMCYCPHTKISQSYCAWIKLNEPKLVSIPGKGWNTCDVSECSLSATSRTSAVYSATGIICKNIKHQTRDVLKPEYIIRKNLCSTRTGMSTSHVFAWRYRCRCVQIKPFTL